VTAGLVGPVVLVAYLILVLAIGWISSRGQGSPEDFWVAGRSFGVPLLVMANVGSMLHGGAILSHIGFAGHVGGVAVTTNLSYALGFAVIFFFFAAKLRRSRGFTLSDFMGDRFDSRLLRGWTALVVAVTSILYLVAQIRAMGFVMERLLGLEFWAGQLVGTAIFVAYVALGGLSAVVWTNVLQLALLWIGLLVLAPSAHSAVGDFSTAMARVEAVAPGWTSPSGVRWSTGYLLSWYVLVFIAYSTRLELLTKVFAARDEGVARRAIPWTAVLVIAFLAYGGLYLGAAARILVWDSIATPDEAFPALVATLLGPLGTALALTGVACAIMSTTDSLLLMTGSAVAHDFLRRCIDEPRGIRKSDAYYLRVSRLTVVVVGAVSFLLALPDVALILELVAYALAIVGSSFFFPLLAGLWSPRVSREAATSASIAGGLTASVCTVFAIQKAPWALQVHPIVPGLAVSAILIVTVSLFTRPVREEAVRLYFT
jgi:Na+/proline symporter